MAQPVFHRPLKISVVLLLLAGVAMATTALIAALSHDAAGQAWAFLAVVVALGVAAAAVARGVRWVVVVCFVGLAGQLAAIAGTAAELAFGVAAVKQRQLHSLGFDPTTAVALNLVYSTIGFGLFCWLAARWIRRHRDLGTGPEPGRYAPGDRPG